MNSLSPDKPGLNFQLPVAANFASTTDHIFIALLVLSSGVLILVVGLMITFAVRYRAGSSLDRGTLLPRTFYIEIGWTTATFIGFLGLFYWGGLVFLEEFRPPPNALQIHVVGKQWMWKVEHPGGQKEINTIHIPVNQPVQLIMTSEDVIHDVGIPAFRLKRDVLPGRYENMWFISDVPGTYWLFCDQLCGSGHSLMRGQVITMAQPDYQQWLESNGTSVGLVADGQRLFIQLGCSGCHGGNGTVRAPSLAGVYKGPVPLSDGTTVIADEKYIRDSILFPKKQVVASFEPVMPSFDGKVSDADLEKLIAYIKSLGSERVP